MAQRLRFEGPEADSLEVLEAEGGRSTLRMRQEEIDRRNQRSTLQRRLAKGVSRAGPETLLNTLRRGSVRLQAALAQRQASGGAAQSSEDSNGNSEHNRALFSAYGQVDVPDEALALEDGSFDTSIFEDVARFGDEREVAHDLLRGPRELYRVYPGKVALLTRLLNVCAANDMAFVSGSLYVRCGQSKTWMGKRQIEADPEDHASSTLRMHDAKTYPTLVQDLRSPACFLAQEETPGAVQFDRVTEEIPYQDVVVLNRVSFAIARAADRAHALYLEDGSFPLDEIWSAPADSKAVRFAHRLSELLVHMLRLPQAFPVAHLGGFASSHLRRYKTMVPTAVKLARRQRGQQNDRDLPQERDTPADLRLDAYEICDMVPRGDFEELVLAECTGPVHVDAIHSRVEGGTLLVCSPLFAYYVRGGGPRYPDPNHDFSLAVSMLFNAPCVDRTGTIVDPNVRLSAADRMPRVRLGATSKRYVGGTLSSSRLAAYDRLADLSLGLQSQVADECGVSALMQKRAEEAVELAHRLGLKSIQILLTGDPGSVAALMAFVDLGPERFLREQLFIKVAYVADALPEALSALRDLWSGDGVWAHIVEPEPFENVDLSEIVDLDGSVVVSCAHSDLIFGSPLYASFFSRHPSRHRAFCGAEAGPAQLDQKWQQVLREEIQRRTLVASCNVEPLMSLLRHQADLAPFEIHSLRDYLWWTGFTMLWNRATVDIASQFPRLSGAQAQHVFHYYRDDDWQRWSLDATNHELLKFPRSKSGYQLRHCMTLLKAYAHRVSVPLLGAEGDGRELMSDVIAYGGGGEDRSREGDFSAPAAFAVTSAFEVICFGPRSHLVADLEMAYAGDLLGQYLRKH